MMKNRREIENEKINDRELKNFCKNKKIKIKLSSILKLTSTLNIVQIKTYDLFHFE